MRHGLIEVRQQTVEVRQTSHEIGITSTAERHVTATTIRHGEPVRESSEGTAAWSYALSPGAIGRRVDVTPQIEISGGATMSQHARTELAGRDEESVRRRWSELQQLPTFDQEPIDVSSLRSPWIRRS